MNAHSRLSRGRRAILGAGLGMATLALSRRGNVAARVILLRGMSGGGMAQLEGSDAPRLADFGLFASAMQLPDGSTLVLGTIQWIEAGTDLELQSIEVTQCQPAPNRDDTAEIRGRVRVNGEGDYPFLVRATDSGRPGSALDRIEIEVNTPAALQHAAGEASDDTFVYEAAGNLVAGDFQWIIADAAADL
jgi:hypothetical protein